MFQDTSRSETARKTPVAALMQCGIDDLFAIAGPDFPPVIEGFARLPGFATPNSVTVRQEMAGMVQVKLGAAYAVMGGSTRPQTVRRSLSCPDARLSRCADANRIESGEDLPVVLARATEVIRTERRQVLRNPSVAAPDMH